MDQDVKVGFDNFSINSGQLVCPTYFDDFSKYTTGQLPSGWDQFGTSAITPVIEEVGRTGDAYKQLSFPSLGGGSTDKWLVYRNLTCPDPTVTVKLNFRENADSAGILLAWIDQNNFIKVQPNPYWDYVGFDETVNGVWRTRTGVNNVPISPFTDYWLRVSLGRNQSGTNAATVYWSTDGLKFQSILTFDGLVNATGKVGLVTSGFNLPHTHFDDFTITGSCQSTSLPDLMMQSIGDPPASVGIGTSFDVVDWTRNYGLGPAGTSTTRFYLSLDQQWSADDILLLGARTVPTLGPTESSSGSTAVPVPTTTPAGSYYLIACADDLKTVTESDETNNCRLSAGRVTLTTYSISGRVTDSSGTGIGDVTVSAGPAISTTTDTSGNYTLSGLGAGVYTLTATKSGYSFAPASRLTRVPSDATGQNFTGTSTHRYIIFIDGLNSESYGGIDKVRTDFARTKEALLSTIPGGQFIYFSYGAGKVLDSDPQGDPRTAWEGNSYDNGSKPIYYQDATTDFVIPVHSWGLNWMVNDILQRDPDARIDIIGYSLGGVVAMQWASQFPTDATLRSIHRVILLDSPIGGINPVARSQFVQLGLDQYLHVGNGTVLRELGDEQFINSLSTPLTLVC